MKNKQMRQTLLSPCQVVAWNLERIRRHKGWSQEEAAIKLEPYLGYRLSRAAFSQAERSLAGKRIRRFDADEIVAFARVFEVPIGYFFCVPVPQLHLRPVVVNTKPGKPRARVTSQPLSRKELLALAQSRPDRQTNIEIAKVVAPHIQKAIATGVVRYIEEQPQAFVELLQARVPPDLWEKLNSDLELDRNAISEHRLAQEVLDALLSLMSHRRQGSFGEIPTSKRRRKPE